MMWDAGDGWAILGCFVFIGVGAAVMMVCDYGLVNVLRGVGIFVGVLAVVAFMNFLGDR